MIYVFIISAFLLFYTYAGYGIIFGIINKIKKPKKNVNNLTSGIPTVSLIMAMYNEEDIIKEKIKNCIDLTYPFDKIEYVFITDGSTDSTTHILNKFKKDYKNLLNIRILHKNIRTGKTAAINRAMTYITSDIVIFSDANTMLNSKAVTNIVKCYEDPKVGAVAGEKKVQDSSEGLYWKYESYLKKLDSDIYSCVGAAGELFSIRTKSYKEQPNDTILDDLMISISVIEQGYVIKYESEAYAIETGSANIKEELKRKIRIAAGGIQSIARLKKYLLPINLFNIQFISRKVFRWIVAPITIILILMSNVYLVLTTYNIIWDILLIAQAFIIYIPTLIYLINPEKYKNTKLHIPFYFMFMHYAVVRGWFRYMSNSQDVKWEKSIRKKQKVKSLTF